MSLVTGIVIISTWIAFCLVYNIRFTPMNLIFLLITAMMTFGLALIANFKKQIWLAQMQNSIDMDKKE